MSPFKKLITPKAKLIQFNSKLNNNFEDNHSGSPFIHSKDVLNKKENSSFFYLNKLSHKFSDEIIGDFNQNFNEVKINEINQSNQEKNKTRHFSFRKNWGSCTSFECDLKNGIKNTHENVIIEEKEEEKEFKPEIEKKKNSQINEIKQDEIKKDSVKKIRKKKSEKSSQKQSQKKRSKNKNKKEISRLSEHLLFNSLKKSIAKDKLDSLFTFKKSKKTRLQLNIINFNNYSQTYKNKISLNKDFDDEMCLNEMMKFNQEKKSSLEELKNKVVDLLKSNMSKEKILNEILGQEQEKVDKSIPKNTEEKTEIQSEKNIKNLYLNKRNHNQFKSGRSI